ncbi:phage protein [Streptococcus pneumoniae]|nr:phage protein [Streptococcus pneumoniae]VNK98403.1 phage protein [Streptococcus pneumoniae]
MTYLTKDEFVTDLGFDDVTDFDKLAKRAEIAINLYTQGIYQKHIDFEKEVEYRKSAVKLAMGFQIDYLNNSGIMTADEKQTMTSVSIGRTSINYGNKQQLSAGQQFNLCLDAENALKQAGFSLIVGVDYDR